MDRFYSPRAIVPILSCLLLVGLTNKSNAQFGVQFSSITPKGDLGQFFNKGKSVDVYIVLQTDDSKWKYRLGYFYTALSARMDTVPQYMVQTGGNGTVIYPGYLVNHNFNMQYIVGELDRRVINVKKFSLYLGLGLVVGKSHVDYERGFDTKLKETSSTDVLIGGLKANAMIDYRISSHFDTYIDCSKNMAVSADNTTSYSHYKTGIGFNYFINKRE